MTTTRRLPGFGFGFGFAWLAFSLVGAATRCAAAADPSEPALQSARSLFVAAEADEDAGRWTEALDKLKQVSSVRFTAGVRYHIALCEEHLDRLASALADFRAAEVQAGQTEAGDVLRLVGTEVSSVEPRVPRLELSSAPELGGAVVTLDAATLADGRFDSPFPVDAGPHVIEITAPGRIATAIHVTLKDGEVTVVHLAVGAPAAMPPGSEKDPRRQGQSVRGQGQGQRDEEAPGDTSGSATRARGRPIGPAVALASALVLAGGGVAAYFVAQAESDRAVRDCPEEATCGNFRTAVRAWDWTALGAWAGAALAGTLSIVLWAQPTREPEQRATARLVVGRSSVAFAGTF
jgi:hypothetical protein